MENGPRPFEVTINDEPYVLELGRCALTMFRKEQFQEMDYLVIEHEDEPLRFFGLQELVRWMAGYVILREDDGEVYRPTTFSTEDGGTFRQRFNWNPAVIEKEEPSTRELESYFRAVTQDVDDEWANYDQS